MAANFLTTAAALGERYTETTGHEVTLVSGATGRLYAQIVNGAPFDVFLAADAARPARLEEDGRTLARRTYALGRLVLVTRDRGRATLDTLSDTSVRVAIADPAVAPYGIAAREVLSASREGAWATNIVIGESVGQAYAFYATGNAPAALVAEAQTREPQFVGHVVPVPPEMYAPIRQDAVLLARAAENPAARAFFDALGSPESEAVIAAAGYGLAE